MNLVINPKADTMYIIKPVGQFERNELISLTALVSSYGLFVAAIEVTGFDHGILKATFELALEAEWKMLEKDVEKCGYLATKTLKEYLDALAEI